MKKVWEWLKDKKTYISVGIYLSWKLTNAFFDTGLTEDQNAVVNLTLETLMGYGVFDKLRRNEKENKTITNAIKKATDILLKK